MLKLKDEYTIGAWQLILCICSELWKLVLELYLEVTPESLRMRKIVFKA
jgi:hypothetical protein